jgi:uncharacterized membrane protein
METSPLVGITEENIELVANISYELTFAIVGLILFIFMKYKGVKFELPKQRDKAIAAVCETAGQLTYVYAMSGNGAIAAPILSCVCVVSLLLSRIFLKEKLTKKGMNPEEGNIRMTDTSSEIEKSRYPCQICNQDCEST